jgi:hypothetical protein
MRYTITNLRKFIDDVNGKYPLDEPNGYGTYERFGINKAYGAYRIVEYCPGETSQRDRTLRGSARECALEFTNYMMENL